MSRLVCVKDFEDYAQNVLPKNAWGYYKSGAGSEQTLSLNRTAFSKYDNVLVSEFLFWVAEILGFV